MKNKYYKIEERMVYFDCDKEENMIEESKQTEHNGMENHANQELLEFDSTNDYENKDDDIDEENQLN